MTFPKISIALFGILTGLSFAAYANPGRRRWPAELREPFLSSCISPLVSRSNGRINQRQAESYCNCTLEVLEARYSTTQDFMRRMLREPPVVQELERDGTVRTCLRRAGVPIP